MSNTSCNETTASCVELLTAAKEAIVLVREPAAKAASNEFTFNDALPLLAAVITLIGVVIGAIAAYKAANRKTKLEELVFINTLCDAESHLKPSKYLVVEEAFKRYYGAELTIRIIRIIGKSNYRTRAFSLIGKLGNFISTTDDGKQINMLHKDSVKARGQFIRRTMLFSVLMGLYAAVLGTIALQAGIKDKDSASIVFGVLMWLAFLGSFLLAIKVFNQGEQEKVDQANFKAAVGEELYQEEYKRDDFAENSKAMLTANGVMSFFLLLLIAIVFVPSVNAGFLELMNYLGLT